MSGLEMAQNSQRIRWTREEVDEKLRNTMYVIYEQCKAACEKYNITKDLVAGANIAGFLRVADAFISQGFC